MDHTDCGQADTSPLEAGERHRAYIEDHFQGIFRFEFARPVPVHLTADEQVEWILEHGRIEECNDAYLRLFEFTPGEDMHAITPRRHFGEDLAGTRDLLRRFVAEGYRLIDVESREQVRSGRYVWLRNSLLGIMEDGHLVRMWGTTADISRQKAAEQALRESENRYRITFEQAPVGIINVTPDGHITHINQRACDMLGYTRAELLVRDTNDITHPEDRQRTAEAMALMRTGQVDSLEVEKRYVRKDGTLIWSKTIVTGLWDEDGTLRSLIAVSQDITNSKTNEERQKLMLHELDHRVKNNLASVLSLLDQTVATTETIAEFADTFRGRIQALAKTHELLLLTQRRGADLRELVDSTLAPYSISGTPANRIHGPEVRLSRRTSSPMAMALHELATNAGKYGAMSVPTGWVDVAWTLDPGDAFTLTWAEHDGPEAAPPPRLGTGIVLIRGMIEHDLQGNIDFEFAPAGFRCTMRLSLAEDAAANRDHA